MPGIFGMVRPVMNPEVASRLMHKMLQPLMHYPWYHWAKQSAPGAALGLVSLGTLAPAPRCLRSEDGRYLLAFEGELYNANELQKELRLQNMEGDAAEIQTSVVLQAMMRWGAETLQRFNGIFQLALWDAREQELIVSGDPVGLRPIYFAHKKDQFAFAPEVKALLALPWISREIDFEGIGSFLQHGHPMDNSTFFQDVKVLPAGSVAIFHRGQLQIKRYFELRLQAESHDNEQELQKRFIETWQEVMKRQTEGAFRFAALLDGELDSRLTLAALVAQGKKLPTFTLGNPGGHDALHVQQIAKAACCPNLFSPVLPSEVASRIERTVYLTDGMSNCFHANVMHLLPSLAETVDVVLDSTPPLADENQRRAFATAFSLLRTVVEVRSPYFDKKMLELFTRMSPRHRSQEKPLHQRAICELSTALAGIPWRRTGLPLTAGAPKYFRHNIKKFFARHLGKPANSSNANGQLDCNEMIRASSELQNLITSHLMDSWLENAGHLSRRELRALLNEHLSGKSNHAQRLGRLLTVELWYKQFAQDAAAVERRSAAPVRQLALREAA